MAFSINALYTENIVKKKLNDLGENADKNIEEVGLFGLVPLVILVRLVKRGFQYSSSGPKSLSQKGTPKPDSTNGTNRTNKTGY